MNNINITVELCAEDRARIDKVIEELGNLNKRPDCSACAKGVAEYVNAATAKAPMEWDDLQKKLADALVKAKSTDILDTPAVEPAETPQDASEDPEKLTIDLSPEAPTEAEEQSEAVVEEPKPEVTIEMLKSKVIKLAAKAELKEKVRELVQTYASKVTDIPADKWAEVYMRLDELDGETK